MGPSWARFWSPWARIGCSFGAFNASRWQLRFLKIPPNVHNNNFTSQPWIFQKPLFSRRKIEVFEGEGGNPDFQNFLGEATVHRILRWIMACRSRASSQSFYITYVYIIVSLLSHSLLPDRCFPVFGSPSLSIFTSQADPPTLRNRIRLSIRLRIIIIAPRIFWTHGSAAASAKRTEIRRAVHSLGVARHGVSKHHPSSRELKQFLALKTNRYKTRSL